MKINLNKKDNLKTIYKIVKLLIIIIGVFFILKYFFGTWIYYGDNIAPRGTMEWNSGLSYRIEVSRFGIIKANSRIEMIDKNELKELKKLVKEIKTGEINDKYDYYKDGLFIDGKEYKIDEKNNDAYNRILGIINKFF